MGDGGSCAAQLALALPLRATDRASAVARYLAFDRDAIARLSRPIRLVPTVDVAGPPKLPRPASMLPWAYSAIG